jgi:hypothetical protein
MHFSPEAPHVASSTAYPRRGGVARPPGLHFLESPKELSAFQAPSTGTSRLLKKSAWAGSG